MIGFLKTVGGLAVPGALLSCGAAYLLYLRGDPLRRPGMVLRALTRSGKGEGTSPRKALFLALAGTLGVGNIVGVASALLLGGPGAIFWMWISAILAMTLKYAEVVLAIGHRRPTADGTGGGAAYYIRDALTERGHPFLGWGLAALFAVLCLADALTTGCMLQANAVSRAVSCIGPVPPLMTGVLLAALTFAGIRRGTNGIAALTAVLVPGMAVLFVGLSVAALARDPSRLGPAFASIFSGAFSLRAAGGGAAGWIFLRALRYGCMRGLVSNEAGSGTAPMAHAAAEAATPAEQGFLGIAEVFIDTILLCTLPALVLIEYFPVGAGTENDPMRLVLDVYGQVLGRGAPALVTLAVTLFAYATLLCWAHYGTCCLRWLCRGMGPRRAASVTRLFTLLFCAFAVIGAVAPPAFAWRTADLAIGGMTLLNLAVIWSMRGEVLAVTRAYFGEKKAAGGAKAPACRTVHYKREISVPQRAGRSVPNRDVPEARRADPPRP